MKSIKFLLIVFVGIIAGSSPSAAQPKFTGKPQYQIEVLRADTVMGKIIVEMFPAIAPNSVRNWDSLVTIHFYDSTAFHRVIPGFVIQGGDPNSRSGPKDTWGYGDPDQATVDAEFSSVSHQRGILSAARANDPNSATSQFFICVAAAVSLDRKYSVYGHVVSGMNVADSIVNAKRDANDNPLVKISMFITRLGSNDSLTTTPQLVSPADGSSNGTVTSATLRWHKIPDAMLYRLQFASDNAFTSLIRDSSLRQIDTSCRVTKLTSGTYYWRVLANNGGNASEYSSVWSFTETSLGVRDENISGTRLEDIYPNPVNDNAEIHFYLGENATVQMTVQDILGRNVRTPIVTRFMPSGDHQVRMSVGTLVSGTYIYRLEVNGKSISKRMIIE